MERPIVLEWVRDPSGVWELPRDLLAAFAADHPGARFVSPAGREELEAALPQADIVLGFAASAANFPRMSRLKWIHYTAAGVSTWLHPALVESEVLVTNARGVHATSMAEHAFAMMLAFERQLPASLAAQAARRWTQAEQVAAQPGFGQLEGATLVLVGLGRVGRAIAERARAFGMTVVAVRRTPRQPADPAHEQWPPERLAEVMARADWIVACAPETPQTRASIGHTAFAGVKRGARLINLGRGGTVDEAALLQALREGRLAGASLDVFGSEPLPADSPLWSAPNLIVTPHVSGYGPRYWERTLACFADELERFLAGQPPINRVDKQAGY